MSKNKLHIIMLALTVILLCLIIFCLVYMDEIKARMDWEDQTTQPTTEFRWPTESTTLGTYVPSVTVETTPETTEATLETTVETTVETTEATEATTEPETIPDTDPDIGAAAAEIARQQVGKPYQYGAAGPDMFDTSGLVQYCYAQVGISIPRSNSALSAFGYVVDKADIRPGDAVFFWSSQPGEPEYLGIYVGDGIVVAAMNQSKPVVEFNMNSAYYTEHFVFVRRFY